jgi:hypothetical protein
MMWLRLVAALALAGAGLAACATSPPLPSATALASLDVTSVPIEVHMGGKIGCAQFPRGCWAAVSVLPPDTLVDASWRPSVTDARWVPDYTGSVYSSDHLVAEPDHPVPDLVAVRQLLVVSLLGADDVPSYNPDGTVATDLLARCSSDVDAGAGMGPVVAVVTFAPDPTSFSASCSIKLQDR